MAQKVKCLPAMWEPWVLIATGEAIPLRGLEGVPGLPGAPQDEAGLIARQSRENSVRNQS